MMNYKIPSDIVYSENAFNDPCTLTNPRESSPLDVASIYRAAFYGDKSLLA